MDFATCCIGTNQFDLGIEILQDYFSRHGHTFHVIREPITDQHVLPAWNKLLYHRVIDSDFIVHWDADLLPKHPSMDIGPMFDPNKVNVSFDTAVLLGVPIFSHGRNFKYNTGIFGVPANYAGFGEAIFDQFASSLGPPYEQPHVNAALPECDIPVHVVDPRLNCLYLSSENPPKPLLKRAFCIHYTGSELNPDLRVPLMKEHHRRYFEEVENA